MIIINNYAYLAESFSVPSIPILPLLSLKVESQNYSWALGWTSKDYISQSPLQLGRD